MVNIGNYDLTMIVGRLTSFAEEAGLAGRSVRYVLAGDELVPERQVRQRASLAMRALNSNRRLVTVDLPLAADRIVVGTNARITGLERLPGATAKIQLVGRGAQPSVMREVRARQIAGAYLAGAAAGIPAIRAWDHAHAGWLIEDFVVGRHAETADLTRFVADHVAALYRPSARMRLVKRPANRRLIEVLERSLATFAPSFPPVRSDAKWPVGLGHNDLTLHNLLRAPSGKLWLIDWEHAGVVPLVADLGRVYLDCLGLKDVIIGLLQSFDPRGEALAPRHQLALGALVAAERQAVGRSQLLEAAMKTRGLSEEAARREFDDGVVATREAIAGLAK